MGDTLLAIGDQPARHMDDLLVALSRDRIGLNAIMRVLRAGHVQELKLTIGARP